MGNKYIDDIQKASEKELKKYCRSKVVTTIYFDNSMDGDSEDKTAVYFHLDVEDENDMMHYVQLAQKTLAMKGVDFNVEENFDEQTAVIRIVR